MTLSLDELFRQHAAAVLTYALRRADPATAEDVVSEVFLIAGRLAAPPASRWLGARFPELGPH